MKIAALQAKREAEMGEWLEYKPGELDFIELGQLEFFKSVI